MEQFLFPVGDLHLLLRLGIALLIGAVIGWERETKGKAAGFRTNLLVSFGTALLVLIPIQTGMAERSVEAMSRVIQGVIAGIGFIGGGTILRGDSDVKGLTSAAAIWVSAALGIAAGCGLWRLSLVGVVVGWLILRVLENLEPS